MLISRFYHLPGHRISGSYRYKKSPAFPYAEFLTQGIAAWDNPYLSKVQKLFTLGKKLRALLLEFVTVNNHNDGRRANLFYIGTAQSELAGKKRHRISLSAACSTEIGAAPCHSFLQQI